jgi:hypothetical protein
MTETFTRDSDGAKFELIGEESFEEVALLPTRLDRLYIRPIKQPLKTIDWNVVRELGLLCEFCNEPESQNKEISSMVSLRKPVEGFRYANGRALWKHCRILPDQVIDYGTRDTSLSKLEEAGINYKWLIIEKGSRVLLTHIKPADGYTYEIWK